MTGYTPSPDNACTAMEAIIVSSFETLHNINLQMLFPIIKYEIKYGHLGPLHMVQICLCLAEDPSADPLLS